MKFIAYPNMATSLYDLTPEQDAFIGRAIDRGQTSIKRAIADGRIPPTAASLLAVRNYLGIEELTSVLGDTADISRVFPKSEDNATVKFAEVVRRVMDALDEWLPCLEDRAADLIAQLVDDALNAACRSVQDRLGVQTGDAAGDFFSGSTRTAVDDVLYRYVLMELRTLEAGAVATVTPLGGLD